MKLRPLLARWRNDLKVLSKLRSLSTLVFESSAVQLTTKLRLSMAEKDPSLSPISDLCQGHHLVCFSQPMADS